ncbi:MAG: flagellar hook-basal body protein [Phycisphaerae bacterium]|nr:flagellar hook-basal body protein [Phycisphaerae bacterium]
MNYGMEISASGALSALYRQDVLANNLANAQTVGFKPDVPTSRFRAAAREEDGLYSLASNAMLEKLGAGNMAAPNRISFSQGALDRTDEPLDLAIQGDGFFVVRDSNDAANPIRVTRDGRLARSAGGQLVMAVSGLPVLDPAGNSINLRGTGEIKIDGAGVVTQGGQEAGRIHLLHIPDPWRMGKQGNSLFIPPTNAVLSRTPGTGTIRQGHVEQSSVDSVKALMDVAGAGREVEANIAMIRSQDRMMDRAINALGRVA